MRVPETQSKNAATAATTDCSESKFTAVDEHAIMDMAPYKQLYRVKRKVDPEIELVKRDSARYDKILSAVSEYADDTGNTIIRPNGFHRRMQNRRHSVFVPGAPPDHSDGDFNFFRSATWDAIGTRNGLVFVKNEAEPPARGKQSALPPAHRV